MLVMYSGRSGGSSPFIMSVADAVPGDVEGEVRDGGAEEDFDGCCVVVGARGA